MNQHAIPPRPVDGLPAVIPAQGVDVPRAQVDAINCMIAIIDEPYTGDDCADYNFGGASARRRACCLLKTRMLKEIGWKP